MTWGANAIDYNGNMQRLPELLFAGSPENKREIVRKHRRQALDLLRRIRYRLDLPVQERIGNPWGALRFIVTLATEIENLTNEVHIANRMRTIATRHLERFKYHDEAWQLKHANWVVRNFGEEKSESFLKWEQEIKELFSRAYPNGMPECAKERPYRL